MELSITIADAHGAVLSEARGDNEIFLVHRQDYSGGDIITLGASEPCFIWLSLDAALPPAIVFIMGESFSFPVPANGRQSYSPQSFTGGLHRLSARRAQPHEIEARRNLAFNPFDHHGNKSLFPHASANVETRGEAAFAARNAIDGEKANDDHGFWPYTSWGINRDPAAALTVNFGREVLVDEMRLYLRADFPHDAWWQKAALSLSDGHTMTLDLRKTGAAQVFSMPERKIEWIRLHDLEKAEDPSPFPALTQIEIWGRDQLRP